MRRRAGDGTFTEALASPYSLTDNGRQLTVNDFNNDAILDVAAVAEFSGTIHVFLGN